MKNTQPKTVGERVKAARNGRKLTQIDLAAAAGITQGTLSVIEGDTGKGKYSARAILGIARALGLSPYYVLWGNATDRQGADEALAIHDGLAPKARAAWLAAGRAMLGPDERPLSADESHPRH